MRILQTGKRVAGYTLLEVVAVITLIGLLAALTMPRINLAVEQVEVGYIGRLVQSDFKQIKDQSVLNPFAEMVVTFKKDGYSFNIGEHSITRSFHYQFVFQLPEEDTDNDTSGTITSENTKANSPDDATQTNTDQSKDANRAPYEIRIVNGELLGDELSLQWQT
ncbi:MAG TPA: hypothetical protein DDW50_11285, partial [Firmicutes bacterium]|nr:hypothetical protein [Bacillota bacterium]